MTSAKHPVDKAKKVKEYQCLKIVESLINGDEKTAKKHLRKLVEKRLNNKFNFILKSENLI